MGNQIRPTFIFLCILMVAVFSCQQEDSDLSSLEGNVRFGGISFEFAPMGTEGGRQAGLSPWVHVFPNSAEIIFTNKVSGEQYLLKYNPSDFSTPYSISLPYGAYEFYSKIEAGIFSDYLPFEAKGEFVLDSQSLEISLLGKTDYGLITVKNEFLDEATVSKGNDKSTLVLPDGGEYRYKYVKGETATTLKIIESILGSTFKKEINVVANIHYNFILKRGEGTANITDLLIDPFELEDEEIIIGSPVFFEENGTIKCPQASPGDKGEINGKVYEAVDRALLIQRRDEGASLSCVCTSLVTSMNMMFFNSDFNQDISSWDVSNVSDMFGMFFFATKFNQPIGNWDVSNVKIMSFMFRKSGSFNQPIENWDVSNVTDMYLMFSSNLSFNKPIGNWNVGNVKDMSGMFLESSFNQPIGDWDVSNVAAMYQMFEQSLFNQPLGDWDVGNVTNMAGMFYESEFNQPIGNWDVSNVINMGSMFEHSIFNQPLGDWDVGNVTNMNFMFSLAKNFNQDLTQWCVQNIQVEPDEFSYQSPLISNYKPVWGTCPN